MKHKLYIYSICQKYYVIPQRVQEMQVISE